MKCPLLKKRISTSGGSRIFPRRAPTPNVAVLTYYFAIFFAENCMKMKEFGSKGAAFLASPWIRQCVQLQVK